ncbi:hypothetical protein [Cupriavidus sp. EM10]|uniref:hypothetical protein n=1 Tax=Cupriavidus sp. EM10 TaxID=2839983 RepID=UPI001CED82E9|nr:hypothetical protein [Cupriavidus sp. EM10]
MIGIRPLLIAAIVAPLLAACASGSSMEYLESQDGSTIHSDASVGELVGCLKRKLGDDATVDAYPNLARSMCAWAMAAVPMPVTRT